MTKVVYLKYTRETILKHRRKWLAALESGDYRRTSSFLVKLRKSDNAPTAYCCLGVAMTLAKVNGVPDVMSDGTCVMTFDNQETYLTKEGMDWLGVSNSSPRVNFPDDHPVTRNFWDAELASLNDRGWTFKQIAEAVRKYGFHPNDDLLA